MKLAALRDFIAVAERGSLRAAARALGNTQPAISRNIRELEKELGTTLFERYATGVRLTPMGQVFLRRANHVQNELRLAKEELDQLRGSTQGRLTVALSSVPHIAWLPYVLRPFRQRYPDVVMDIIDAVFPTIESDLLDGRVDCYIGPVPNQINPMLVREKLLDNSRVIVGRRGHPLAHAKSLAELVGAEWITTSITHKAEEEIGPLFAHHGLPAPRLVMQAHSALTFLVAIASSDLLMLLPRQWIHSPLLNEAVQRIQVVEDLPAPQIGLLRRAGLPFTPAAEYFCDLMRRASAHP